MVKKLFFYLTVSLFIALVTSFPYIYGYFQTKPGEFFLARSVVNSGDIYVYLSNIVSAKEGQLLLPNLYSTESKTPFLFRPSYLFLGQIAKVFSLDPLTAYHLGRFIFTLGFTVAICYLIDLTGQTKRQKTITFVLVFFTSGFGGLLTKHFPGSIDLWIPEANTFFSLLESPHFIWSETCLVLTIIFAYQFLTKKQMRFLQLSSLTSAFAIFDYPYLSPFLFLLIPILILLSDHQTWRQKFFAVFQILFLPGIAVIFIFFTTRLSPVASFWISQNKLLTPNFMFVLSGYGLLLPLSMLGFFKSKKDAILKYFFGAWALIQFLLVYAPFPFQRRLFLGLHIPLAIISSWGILWFYKTHQSPLARLLIIICFLLLPVTTLVNTKQLVDAYTDPKTRHLYYINSAYIEAMNWLHTHAQPEEVVVAHAFIANILPGFSGRFVFFGHKIQTYRFSEKMKEYQEIEQSNNDMLLKNYLLKNNISYIFISPFEFKEYAKFLSEQPFLQNIWEKDGVKVYKVTK